MKDVTLTVVVPTIGRVTLARTLLSLKHQKWIPGDQVLVVGDGRVPTAEETCQLLLPTMPVLRYLETPRNLGVFGHGVRNWVNDHLLVRTTHAACLDDDDVFTPTAVQSIRNALAAAPHLPHVFRMNWIGHDRNSARQVLWRDRKLEVGNYGTPCFAFPAIPDRLGRWGDRYCGDHDFLVSTCRKYKTDPVWREEVICVTRPGWGTSD